MSDAGDGFPPVRQRFWRTVSAAGMLVALGLTFARYPDTPWRIIDYLLSFGRYGRPALPPYPLGEVVAYSFVLGGVWSVVSSGLRFCFGFHMRTAVVEVARGLESVLLASLLGMYCEGAVTGGVLAALFIVAMGVVAIVANPAVERAQVGR